MKIEQDERQRINSIKEKEKMQTSKEIEHFKKSTQTVNEKFEKDRNDDDEEDDDKDDDKNKQLIQIKKQIINEVEESLPEPRACKILQVKFTPRVFPTPQRESTQKQENEVGLK